MRAGSTLLNPFPGSSHIIGHLPCWFIRAQTCADTVQRRPLLGEEFSPTPARLQILDKNFETLAVHVMSTQYIARTCSPQNANVHAPSYR